MPIKALFSSLKHRSFQYYFLGMCVSTLGTWMQNAAQPWLAYELTDSAALLGLVAALQFTPQLLLSLFAGDLVDRFPKKKVLLLTQSALLTVTLALALLVSSGAVRYWHLLASAAALGLVNTLDMPARQAYLNTLVEKPALMNAIALNSAAFNLARALGPALAGLTLRFWGLSACFFINAASFGAVLISLFLIRQRSAEPPPEQRASPLKSIADGLKYIHGTKPVYNALLMTAAVSSFSMCFGVLTPVFSRTVLGQAETGYGLLMGCVGAGAFLGAMYAAAHSAAGPKTAFLLVCPLLAALSLILTGITSAYALTALGLGLSGFFLLVFAANANAAVQMAADGKRIGRVMSVYTLASAGTIPLGNLLAGALAERFGARFGFIGCGALLLMLVGAVWLHARISGGFESAAADGGAR